MGLINAANGAHDADRQLAGAHLHRKHRHGQLLLQGHMLSDVDGQRGFSHGGAGRQHHQIAGLQARGHAVKIIKTSGHTGDVIRVVGHLLDTVHQADHQGVHGLKALAHARTLFANAEDFLFGLIEDLRDLLALRVEGLGGDFIAH